MRYWEKFSSFKKALEAWDKKAKKYKKKDPLKEPKNINSVENHNFLFKLKSLKYLLKTDKNLSLTKSYLKRPIFHTYNLLKSYFKPKPYTLIDDLYLFNSTSIKEIKKHIQNPKIQLVLGFSYCQKPKECPDGKFSSLCQARENSPICSKCFIGKCANFMQKEDIFLTIKDINMISNKIFELLKNKREIIFLITACDLSMKMFSDFANMLKIKGVGIKLRGRVCVNYNTFLLSETSNKKSITTLSYSSEELILDFLKDRHLINL